ncbi:MAG: TIM barrel protein [Planctomycetes bacterium]|nr:TIM barrel protein [Planctomycetota bacterium]
MRLLDRRTLIAASAALASASHSFASRAGAFCLQPAPDPDEVAARVRQLKTRFAVNAEIWWGALPFEQRVEQALAHGFDGIEFWPWRNKDLAALEKLAKDKGVKFAQFTAWGFEPGLCNPDNHAKAVEEVRAACKAAQRIGAPMMTVVAGNNQKGMTTEQMHAHVTTGLKLLAPIAEEHGVMLILEPMNGRVDHPGHCLYGSEAAVRICREVNSKHVKINWDLYHMQLAEGDLCGRLKDGLDQLGYVQVADTPGRNEPGTGEIHWPRVFRAVAELGYKGYIGLECWPKDGEAQAIERLIAADQW